MSEARHPLRILQVISSAAQSGAERHCVDLCRHLRSRGHLVWAAVPAHSWLESELKANQVPTLGCRFKKLGGLFATAEVCRLIRRESIQVVHSHLSRATLQTVFSSRLSGAGHVATVHIRSADVAYKLATRKRGRVIAVSEFIKKTLAAGGVKEEFVRVVYNGSDFGEGLPLGKGALPRDINLPENAIILGVVGRIAKDKGQDLALEALVQLKDRLPNLHLAFIGRTADTAYEESLRSRSSLAMVSERVHFVGPQSSVVQLVDALDILLLPSVMESFGLAALEAMLRGKPVIAANVGGLPELVCHESTGLVINRDPGAWADAIAMLLECPERRAAMGREGQLAARERFSVETMISRLESVYDEVVQR